MSEAVQAYPLQWPAGWRRSTSRESGQGFTALPAPEQWFTILGVSATATRAQIEDAYRRLAMKHHPDRNPGNPNAAAEMARINAAREDGLQRAAG